MTNPKRFLPDLFRDRQEPLRLLTMFLLYFLVVSALGILRPIKNSLALDGLGDILFYRVYLVSGLVVFFVPLYNRLSNRISGRWLIPGVALFFAGNLALFRLLYAEGSAGYGIVFYGWYDLFAAALVTQFFMATQQVFNARDAKRAYPLVIAGGSLGAAAGGAVTGFLAESLGTPNLLLVAAAAIALFGLCLPFVRAPEAPDTRLRPVARESSGPSAGELRRLFANRQLRLIAASVLLTVLVKQLVDYQFNALSEQTFAERDAISAFQGKFFAATQWLPIVILAGLRPLLRRYGVGIAVLLLPAAVLLANVGMVLWFGIWAATAAKGIETSFRYSAERTGREILYVPVPQELKLEAKAYIDVALEKGVGKVLSAVLIFAVLGALDDRVLPWVTVAAAGALLAVSLTVRREYVRTLARSIQGRAASLRGIFATVTDASTVPVLREALEEGSPAQLAFALDLLAQADPDDARALAPELRRLLKHRAAEIRARATEVLGRISGTDGIRFRDLLADPAPAVREAAAQALFRAEGPPVLADLLASEDPAARGAALSCLTREEIPGGEAASLARTFLERRRGAEDPGAARRRELALAAGVLAGDEPAARRLLEPLMDDPDPRVASAAARGAGRLDGEEPVRALLRSLARPGTREAAREALANRGKSVVPLLEERLRDEAEELAIRRQIPPVLDRIPEQPAVDALLRAYADPGIDRIVAFRTLRALNRLRARRAGLVFPEEEVASLAVRAADAALRYAGALGHLRGAGAEGEAAGRILERALEEAWEDRREAAFRCLGLVHPPDRMYRCYLAVTGGDGRSRANALEWLERTVGHGFFARLSPLLEEAGRRRGLPVAGNRAGWRDLRTDPDRWVARCAAAAAGERERNHDLELLEKVFLLQNVDLLRGTRSSYLALLASVAEEVVADAGTSLLRRGEPTDALYVVIDGAVELEGVAGDTLTLGAEDAFGTWALIDEEPSLVKARTAEESRLLRISRRDFYDLLAEHGELSRDLLRGLARRVRNLADHVAEEDAT